MPDVKMIWGFLAIILVILIAVWVFRVVKKEIPV